MTTVDDMVTQLALEQHGVFSNYDLRLLGVTQAARRHRLGNGRWIPVHKQVYAIAGVPLSWHGRLLAACKAGGPAARASHRSGGVLLGYPEVTKEFVEITCGRWRRRREPWLVVHETLAVGDDEPRLVEGIPVTSPARTLLDLGAVCPPSVVEACLDHAVRTEMVGVQQLLDLLDDIGRRGRNGTGVLRAILDQRGDQSPTESVQETRLVRALRRHGFTGFVPQFEVRHRGLFVARVDVAFPASRIAVEYDSFRHHTGRDALVRDSARRNQLLAAGWLVITVTAADLRAFNAVSASLRAAIATRGDAKTT